MTITALPSASDFRQELARRFSNATTAEDTYVDVVSADLHRSLGGYPGTNHRMPVCCSVMRKELRAGDTVLAAPPGDAGATLRIRYMLPR
jgi:5-methylcytosine-specific restriction protein A